MSKTLGSFKKEPQSHENYAENLGNTRKRTQLFQQCLRLKENHSRFSSSSCNIRRLATKKRKSNIAQYGEFIDIKPIGFCQDFPPHLLSSGIKIEAPNYYFGKMGETCIDSYHQQPQATCGTSTPTIVNQSPADPKSGSLLMEEIHQLIVYPTFWKVEVLHPRAFNHQPSTLPPFQVTPGDTNRPDLEGHVCVRSHRYKWLPVSAQKSPR